MSIIDKASESKNGILVFFVKLASKADETLTRGGKWANALFAQKFKRLALIPKLIREMPLF